MGSSAIGLGSLSSQASLQQVREDQMLQQMKGQNGANDDAKIEKGSKQFEAMLLGTPVIATQWSGSADYLTEETGYPIASSLRPVARR